jgi:glucan phosphoethanolaminetransferase (alkaline phosphatase superfamily)
MVLALRQHFANANFSYELNGEEYAEIASGGDYLGISETQLAISVIAGVIFLGVAFLAWRGKPSSIRFVMLAAVLLLAAFYAFSAVQSLLTPSTLNAGIDSLDTSSSSRAVVGLIVYGLAVLYVVWYINRGPSRAFYRGYYLPAPETPSVPTPN